MNREEIRIQDDLSRELSKEDEKLKELLQHPEEIGRLVGFTDLTEKLHGQWILEMVNGEGDFTLQAHRGSFKSSSLAVAISLLIVIHSKQNIIFLRKTDNDVSEMLGMVSKILRSQIMSDISNALYGHRLQIVSESQTHLSTNLWTSPMGAPQLLGMGIKSSITGKHAWYVITDDICNKDDRESRAERERTKRQYDELQNIRNRGGRIINLGTPWHKDDVFSKMPKIRKFDCYTTGLISKEKLEELRQSMAPSLFAANYELKHIASSEVIFETAPRFTDDVTKLRDGISHIDAAYGGRDYTAFTCGKRDWDNDIIYGKKDSPTDSRNRDDTGSALLRMSTGGRFSKPTSVQVAEDGDAEYIIPVKKENRALPLLKQLLGELSPAARASLTGGAGSVGTAALSATLPSGNVTQNNQNVSAPVTINVNATGSNAEQIGETIYNTAERYLLRTLQRSC